MSSAWWRTTGLYSIGQDFSECASVKECFLFRPAHVNIHITAENLNLMWTKLQDNVLTQNSSTLTCALGEELVQYCAISFPALCNLSIIITEASRWKHLMWLKCSHDHSSGQACETLVKEVHMWQRFTIQRERHLDTIKDWSIWIIKIYASHKCLNNTESMYTMHVTWDVAHKTSAAWLMHTLIHCHV